MFKKGFRYVFMAEETGGEGGGAAGSEAAASADGDAGAGSGAAAVGEAGASGDGTGATASGVASGDAGTALQSGAQTPTIPEKYQVKKEDGSIDVEASSLKLAEAYGHLEKRLGSGDVPPKSVEEYEIAVPEALKESWNPKEDPLLQDFLKSAHAAGFTQKQIDLAMTQYMDIAPKLVNGSKQISSEECTTELRSEWKTDDQYKAEVGKAYKAAIAYGDRDGESIIRDYGNDPRIVRMMARIGAELGEDKSLNPGGSTPTGKSVESLMSSEAYTNPKHADHARVSAQVQKHFQSQAAAAEKAGGVPIF